VHQEGGFSLIELAGNPAQRGVRQGVRTFDDGERIAVQRAVCEHVDEPCCKRDHDYLVRCHESA
jgi:hypothetical protein